MSAAAISRDASTGARSGKPRPDLPGRGREGVLAIRAVVVEDVQRAVGLLPHERVLVIAVAMAQVGDGAEWPAERVGHCKRHHLALVVKTV